jgi:peptidoglycan-associated lipoprotein
MVMNIKVSMVLVGALFLSACTDSLFKSSDSADTQIDENADAIEIQGNDVSGVSEEAEEIIDQGNPISDDDPISVLRLALEDPENPMSSTTIYFDFDQNDIKSEFQETLTAHAAALSKNPSVSVVLEGYCDERGTPEYNLALSERRAISVKDFFLVNGVSSGQIEAVPYGENSPAVEGSDEAAWAKNRRVKIVYPGL